VDEKVIIIISVARGPFLSFLLSTALSLYLVIKNINYDGGEWGERRGYFGELGVVVHTINIK
jgi:hypothetical protein